MPPHKKTKENNDDWKVDDTSSKDILDQVDGFIFQFIYDENTGTYAFPYVSGGLKSIYGLSPSDLGKNGSNAFKLVADEDKDAMKLAVYTSMKELKPWQQDYRLNSPTKGKRWLRGNAVPRRIEDGRTVWNGYISDITEIKQAETELRSTKERYEFAIEGSKMGLWDWNLETNKVYYSDKSLDLLGLTRDEIVPHEDTWNDRVHPDDKDRYFNDINEHFKGATPYYSNEHRILREDGSYIWVLDKGKTVDRDSSGRPIRVIGTHTDITISKEQEQAILNRNELIENHNERLKNFALIVSHNLRTHAGNLKDILRLIDEAETEQEKQDLSSYLKDISSGLSGTISNLDEIVSSQSKINEEPKIINLKTYINVSTTTLRSKIEKKKVVLINNVPETLEIRYNAAYLESIIHNLLSNAIKYSHSERTSEVIVSTSIVGDDLYLSVKDNGVGIDLEQYGNKLFGMYNTFHQNEDAKGLGLFMTKNQVENMGDRISVQSTINEGSTFTVHFKNKLA